MKLLDVPCVLEKWRKRGYTEKIVERLRHYGLAEYAYGRYWSVIPSPILLEVSELLPRCAYKERQNNSPTVGEFIDIARRHGNLYFVTMVKPQPNELFVIEGLYIPPEEKDLVEWAKSYEPDVIGETQAKGETFIYCWWD